jgi:hypothetical protein
MNWNKVETADPIVSHALTAAEIDRARLYLEQTRSGVAGAIRNLSEAQWTFKPDPGRWSIAEIMEHVLLVHERVLGPLQERLKAAPPAPPHPDYQRIDDIVIYQFPNRLTKVPSPIQVAGGLTHTEALRRLPANYARLQELLESTPDLRARSTDAPPLKAVTNGAYDSMDGYQWILAAAAHTERHTKQILEVMADPGYPA